MPVFGKEEKEHMRKLSAGDLKLIGEGRTADVYELSETEVLKVYHPFYQEELIYDDWNNTRRGMRAGIPCAGALEMVRVGDDRLGTIYERVSPTNISEEINKALREKDENEIHRWISYYADFAKKMHQLLVKKDELPTAKEICRSKIEELKGSVFPEELCVELQNFTDQIPDNDTFLHGDFNFTNVPMPGEGDKLIDIGWACIGDEIFDFLFLGTMTKLIGVINPNKMEESTGITIEQWCFLEEEILKQYFKELTEAQREYKKKQIDALGILYGISNLNNSGIFQTMPDLKEICTRIMKGALR